MRVARQRHTADSRGLFFAIDAVFQIQKDRGRHCVWGHQRKDSIADTLKPEGEDATQWRCHANGACNAAGRKTPPRLSRQVPNQTSLFSKFSDHEIAARATTLGVSLGSNESEIEHSIVSLKQIEEDRRITYLQNNLNENLGEETDCGILDIANQLCSDLELEDRVAPMGDSLDPVLSMPIKLLRRWNKKNVSNLGVSVRRSTRINNFKKGLK
jgi:hypothetical protein